MDTHTCLKRARLKTDPIVDTIQTPVEDLLIDKLCTFLMKPFDYSKEQAPIVTAVLLERMDDLHRLVKEGADIDAQDELGRSALIMAIEQDYANPEWVEFLISNGINYNLQDNDGDTALDLARYRGNQDAIDLLIKNNAIGKIGSSAKEQQWDQIYDAFDSAAAIKKLKFIK